MPSFDANSRAPIELDDFQWNDVESVGFWHVD